MLLLAQREQPQCMIYISVGQEHRSDGSVAWILRRGLERGRGFDLTRQIGRRIDQEPAIVLTADSDA